MSIQRTKTVDVIDPMVGDDYQVVLTVTDINTGSVLVIDADTDEAISLADDIFEAATEAKNKRLADEREARAVPFGFDSIDAVANVLGLPPRSES